MASDWTGSISVAVTEASVGYVATGANPDAIGVAEISGNASLSRISDDAEPPRQEFHISLTIQGQSASEAKREAHLWPDVMNEITDNDDVIGILFKVDEFEQRRGVSVSTPRSILQTYGQSGDQHGSNALFSARHPVRVRPDS
jgi:hypothetical protein